MLLACRARPKSTEGPHSTAQNYHKHGSSLAAHPLTPLLDAKNTYYHIKNISLSGQDGPRWAKTPNFQDLPAALIYRIYGPCRSRRFKECNEVDSENLPRSMEIEIHYVQETFNAASETWSIQAWSRQQKPNIWIEMRTTMDQPWSNRFLSPQPTASFHLDPKPMPPCGRSIPPNPSQQRCEGQKKLKADTIHFSVTVSMISRVATACAVVARHHTAQDGMSPNSKRQQNIAMMSILTILIDVYPILRWLMFVHGFMISHGSFESFTFVSIFQHCLDCLPVKLWQLVHSRSGRLDVV